MVVAFHLYTAAGYAALGAFGITLGYLHTGVDLFFVLSGFCLFYPLTRPGSVPNWRAFFRRRAQRILPPYYAAMVMVIVVPFLLSSLAREFGASVATVHWPSWGQIVTHLLMLHTFSSSTFFGIDGPFWSLGVETQFYLAFPLAVWLIHRYGRAGVAVIGAGTVAYRMGVALRAHGQVTGAFLGYLNPTLRVKVDFFLGHWLEFGLGMLVALLVRQRGTRMLSRPLEVALLALVVGLYALAQVYVYGAADRWLYPLADALLGSAFAILLLLACTHRSLTERLFAHRIPAGIGAISYSLYLLHYPIVDGLHPWFISWHLGKLTTLSLAALVSVPLILACAMPFFYLFERPFLTAPPRTGRAVEKAVAPASAALLME